MLLWLLYHIIAFYHIIPDAITCYFVLHLRNFVDILKYSWQTYFLSSLSLSFCFARIGLGSNPNVPSCRKEASSRALINVWWRNPSGVKTPPVCWLSVALGIAENLPLFIQRVKINHGWRGRPEMGLVPNPEQKDKGQWWWQVCDPNFLFMRKKNSH